MRFVEAVVKIPEQINISSWHMKRFLTSKYCTPSGREAQQTIVAFRCDGSDPVVHPSLDGICRDEFGKRGTEEGLQDPDQDKPVDDCDRSIGVLQTWVQTIRAPGPPALMAVIRPNPSPATM